MASGRAATTTTTARGREACYDTNVTPSPSTTERRSAGRIAASAPSRAAAWLVRPAGAALLVVVAGAAAYANTLEVPFVFDDLSSIVANEQLKSLGAFTWSSFLASNRWVADLTFALDRAVHGLDVTGYHLVNGTIHLANGLLSYALVSRLFATRFVAHEASSDPEGTARGAALAAALAFVVHPIQTEAVTYVVQRYTSLATFFFLATVVLYLEWRRAQAAQRARAWGLWIVALTAAVLAMRTKEIAFTLPAVLVLLEALFFEGGRARRLAALLPFLATMILVPAALLSASGSLADVRAADPFAASVLGAGAPSRVDYFFTQLRVVVEYLRLVVLPVGQTLDHDLAIERSLASAPVLGSLAVLLALAAGGAALVARSARGDRRLRIAGFGIAWFFVTLSVESSVIPIDDVIFEHRVYLPSVGLALALAAGLAVAWDLMATAPAWSRRALRAAVACWMVALAGATFARNEVWSDPITLWEDAVVKAPAKARPHQNLAVAYAERGWTYQALREYELVVRIEPDNALGRYNLGHLYAQLGRVDEAIHELREMLRMAPASPATRTTLARLYLQQGRLADAESELRAALSVNPRYVPALAELDSVLRLAAGR